MSKLPRSFYDRDTIVVAQELLGMHLVHVVAGVERVGRIVKVEAYLGPHDSWADSLDSPIRGLPFNWVLATRNDT